VGIAGLAISLVLASTARRTDVVRQTTSRTLQLAAARQPAGGDAEPEEPDDARQSEEERDAIPDRREHSHEARRPRLGARWVAIDAEHCPARGVTGEDIDPEEYVVENS
jgi:hypothetical protein